MNDRKRFASLASRTFIVLGDTSYNTLGQVRSLGQAGIRPVLVMVADNLEHTSAKSKYASRKMLAPDPDTAIDMIVSEYGGESEKPVLITGNDVFVAAIDRHMPRLAGRFITFGRTAPGGLAGLLSKDEQNRLAREAGLLVPEYEVVKVGEMPRTVTYPLITKAIDSTVPGWKGLVHLCRDESELLRAYETMDCESIMLQQYIEKDNETGFNGFSIDGGRDCLLPLQLSYHYTEETTFGESIYLYKPTDTVLLEKLREFVRLTGYSGLFSIDLLLGKDGKVYFLEINPRSSGWSYPYTRAGINLPALWVRSTLQGAIDVSDIKTRRLPFSSVVELYRLGAARREGIGAFAKTLWRVLRSDSYIFWRWGDNAPFRFMLSEWMSSR